MSWCTTTMPPESARRVRLSITAAGRVLAIWCGLWRVSRWKTSISSCEAAIACSQVVPITQAKRTLPPAARAVARPAEEAERGVGRRVAEVVAPVVPLLEHEGRLRPRAVRPRPGEHLGRLSDGLGRHARELGGGGDLRVLVAEDPLLVTREVRPVASPRREPL